MARSLTETRAGLCKQMNIKTSQSLPPHKKLMLQAIKGIHYEVCYCSTVDEAIVNDTLPRDNVWIADNKNEEVMVHWYVFNFMFPFP